MPVTQGLRMALGEGGRRGGLLPHQHERLQSASWLPICDPNLGSQTSGLREAVTKLHNIALKGPAIAELPKGRVLALFQTFQM